MNRMPFFSGDSFGTAAHCDGPGGKPRPNGVLASLIAAIVAAVVLGVAVAATTPVCGASADKPDRASRLDKIERKLERANSAVGTTRTLPRENSRAKEQAPVRSERSPASDVRNSTATSGNAQFDSFRLIVERNIFDPTRIARARRAASDPQPRVETIALVGTMESTNGTVAFFESASPAYHRVAHEGDSLGEFTLQSIQPDHVVLIRAGQSMSLRVAGQLRRPEGGDWAVSTGESDVAAAGDTATSAAAEATPATPAVPADASDVLRRLMEQRQKQLNQ